jgi:hypothetical protein
MSRAIYRTPRTRLNWSTLSDWLQVAYRLEWRRAASLNKQRKQLHVEALPLHLIAECDDSGVLTACRAYLVREQPKRGQRGSAPHTQLIVAINNKLSRLEAAE